MKICLEVAVVMMNFPLKPYPFRAFNMKRLNYAEFGVIQNIQTLQNESHVEKSDDRFIKNKNGIWQKFRKRFLCKRYPKFWNYEIKDWTFT